MHRARLHAHRALTYGVVQGLSRLFVPHQRGLPLIGHAHRWEKAATYRKCQRGTPTPPFYLRCVLKVTEITVHTAHVFGTFNVGDVDIELAELLARPLDALVHRLDDLLGVLLHPSDGDQSDVNERWCGGNWDFKFSQGSVFLRWFGATRINTSVSSVQRFGGSNNTCLLSGTNYKRSVERRGFNQSPLKLTLLWKHSRNNRPVQQKKMFYCNPRSLFLNDLSSGTPLSTLTPSINIINQKKVCREHVIRFC